MWSIDTTTRLLQDMSRSTDPGELVRLFFEHFRHIVPVERALVLSSLGLASPSYRLVHDVIRAQPAAGAIAVVDELRQGGLLAKLLYQGQLQSICDFVPDVADPAYDLLRGSRSLTALPLFKGGTIAGMVVLLGPSPRVPDTADLGILAMMSSLLGRAIELQELANKLEAACRAMDSELKAAADVQRWLLPPTTAGATNARIAVMYQTAHRSGGDYYDIGELPDGRLGVLIADVSGKGAAAAVLMAVLRTIIHDEVDRARMTSPAALLDYADARLCALGLPRRAAFVTAFCCAFDPATGVMTYSSAGHDPPRLLRAQQRTVLPLEGARTTPLGLLDERRAHMEETVVLMPGDLVLFYTDGITEVRSPQGEFFGVEALDEVLRALPEPITPTLAVEVITDAVRRFAGAEPLADDQTLLAVGRAHSGARKGESDEHD